MLTNIGDSDRIDELIKKSCHATEPLKDCDTPGANVEWEEFDQEG